MRKFIFVMSVVSMINSLYGVYLLYSVRDRIIGDSSLREQAIMVGGGQLTGNVTPGASSMPVDNENRVLRSSAGSLPELIVSPIDLNNAETFVDGTIKTRVVNGFKASIKGDVITFRKKKRTK